MNKIFTSLVLLGVTSAATDGIAAQKGAPWSDFHGFSMASVYAVQYEDAIITRKTLSDQQLENAVTQAMQASPLTANSLIVVHVLKGEVTLEGAASSQLAWREATRLAETVLGVTSIRNRLEVAGSETAAVPRQ